MNTLTKAALTTLLAGTIGLTAFVPATFAQQQQPSQSATSYRDRDHGRGFHQHRGDDRRYHQRRGGDRDMRGGIRGGMGGSILSLVCSERGAEALEVALVRMSHRLAITDEQRPAFDDLRNSALAAQTAFADQCAAAASTGAGQTQPDLLGRLRARLELDNARVDALNTLLPKFEAVYKSLTDEQKSALDPRRSNRARTPANNQAPAQPPTGNQAPAQPPANDQAPAQPPAGNQSPNQPGPQAPAQPDANTPATPPAQPTPPPTTQG